MACKAIETRFGPIKFGFEGQYPIQRIGPYLASNGASYLVKFDGGTTLQLAILKTEDKGNTWEDFTGVGGILENSTGAPIPVSASADSNLVWSAASIPAGGNIGITATANFSPGKTVTQTLYGLGGTPYTFTFVIPSSVSGFPALGSTVTVDGETYTFATYSDVNADLAPNLVTLPAYPLDGAPQQILDALLANLINAITGGPGAGTAYSLSTSAVAGLTGGSANIFISGRRPLIGLSVTFHNDILHILLGTQQTPGTDPRETIIKRFDTTDDTFLDDIAGPDVAGYLNDDEFGLRAQGVQRFWIQALSDDRLRVAHAWDRESVGGFLRERVYVSTRTAGVWDAPNLLPGQTGDARNFAINQILCDADDRCLYVLDVYNREKNPVVAEMDGVTQAADDSFGSLGVMATDDVITYSISDGIDYFYAAFPSAGLGYAYEESGVQKFAVPYTASADPTDSAVKPENKVLLADSAANPSWTTETVDSLYPAASFLDAQGVHTAAIYSGALTVYWTFPTSVDAGSGAPSAGQVLYSNRIGAVWTTPAQLFARDFPFYPTGVWPGIIDALGTVGVDISVIDTVAFFDSPAEKANSFGQYFCSAAITPPVVDTGFDDVPYYRKPAYPG